MMYDVVVIGGGPAGYTAAERAADSGLKTLIFEEKHFGGVCLNEGCVPVKTFLHSSKILEKAKNSGAVYGVKCKDIEYDHRVVLERKNKIVITLSSAVRNKMKKKGVDIVEASAKIVKKDDQGFVIEAENKTYDCKKIIIATGSSSAIPGIEGVEEGIKNNTIITSREALQITEIPKSIVIVGAGVIGLEMADFFQATDCEVTVVDFLPQIAGTFDKDISDLLKKSLEKKGINFYLGSKILKISENEMTCEDDQGEFSLRADMFLMATGRRPNVQNIGLENININVEKGSIVTDEYCMTNIFGVYAVGDVNGKSMLAHTAYREAEVAINHINHVRDKMNYNSIPYVIYTNPEVAGIGFTPEQLQVENSVITKIPMAMSGKYVAENCCLDGICKILSSKNDKILGMQVIANGSSEFISYMSMVMENDLDLKDIRKYVFAHPTVSEIIREAAWIKD